MGTLTDAARTLTDPQVRGSVDPHDPTDLPRAPAPKAWRELIEGAFAAGTDWSLPFPQLLLALTEHMEDIRVPVAHFGDSQASLKDAQEELAGVVVSKLGKYRDQIAALSAQNMALREGLLHLAAVVGVAEADLPLMPEVDLDAAQRRTTARTAPAVSTLRDGPAAARRRAAMPSAR